MRMFFGGLVLALILSISAQTAWAFELVPHQAIYQMSLRSTAGGSGVASAEGTMAYKFNDVCEGWTTEVSNVLNLSFAEGGETESLWSLVSWEAKDGSSYRFKVRHDRDGKRADTIDGRAKLVPKGGTATYDNPAPLSVDLPKGFMFPTAHTLEILKRGMAGDKVFSKVVFDGSDLDNPFEVNAVMGAALPAGTKGEMDSPLLAGKSWRVHLAFFNIASKEAAPTFEMSVRYHENGVAQEIIQDFGSFSLFAKLIEIKELPKPDC